MKEVDAKAGTITFDDEDGSETTLPVTGGRVKLQWKPDFGMRWAALGVDFEMFGKDHQTNAPIYDNICDILGGRAAGALRLRTLPRRQGREDFQVEGQRPDHRRVADLCAAPRASRSTCSRSRAPPRGSISTSSRAPSTNTCSFLAAYPSQDCKEQLDNPVWHIHAGTPPAVDLPVTFALLLNLVSAPTPQTRTCCGASSRRYAPGATPAEPSDPRQDSPATRSATSTTS